MKIHTGLPMFGTIAGITLFVSILTSFLILLSHPPTNMVVLKPSTTREIQLDVQRIPNFSGIIILSADIQRNEEQIMYVYSTNTNISTSLSKYLKHDISWRLPLFVKDNDVSNRRIVRLINHSFDCSPWTDLAESKFIYDISSDVSYVCSVGIPPSHGKFNGMVDVLLSKPPTEDDIALLKAVIRDIAYDVSSGIADNIDFGSESMQTI